MCNMHRIYLIENSKNTKVGTAEKYCFSCKQEKKLLLAGKVLFEVESLRLKLYSQSILS